VLQKFELSHFWLQFINSISRIAVLAIADDRVYKRHYAADNIILTFIHQNILVTDT